MSASPEPRSAAPAVPVGIAGFDRIAHGGLPAARSTLVAGTSGAGKTLFGLRFLAHGAAELDEPGVLVSLEEPVEALVANSESFGWELGRLIAAGSIGVVDAAPDPSAFALESGGYDLDALLARIEHEVERVGAKRVLIDSLVALLSGFGDPVVIRRQLSRVIAELRARGLTTVITTERVAEYGDVARFGVEEFVTDSVVIVRNVLDEERRRRTIEILKFRGAGHERGEYPLTIDPEVGLQVIPLSAIELNMPAADDRVSLGVAGIDEMCGGGPLRDSLILVSGATGTGKSLLSASFIRSGLEAGERTLLVSFEESRNQVIRNAASWGIDLETPLAEGRLRIHSQYPDRMGLEDLLMKITTEVERNDAGRVAIDSLTALERVSALRSYREFVSGLSSTLKARQVAGMFVHTASELTGERSVTDAHVSTMSDAIILLRYYEARGELRRCLNVLKVRGSDHSREIREYSIGDAGLELGAPVDLLTGVIGAIPEDR